MAQIIVQKEGGLQSDIFPHGCTTFYIRRPLGCSSAHWEFSARRETYFFPFFFLPQFFIFLLVYWGERRDRLKMGFLSDSLTGRDRFWSSEHFLFNSSHNRRLFLTYSLISRLQRVLKYVSAYACLRSLICPPFLLGKKLTAV